MSDLDSSLRETLSSGASRILNTIEKTALVEEQAAAAGEEPKRLFRHKALNQTVFIKRPKDAPATAAGVLAPTTAEVLENGEIKTITIDTRQARVEKGDIGTTCYVPFDDANIATGGNSFELDGKNRKEALLDILGFDSALESEAVKTDLALLKTLVELPSLDPFLLKERVISVGADVSELYFDIDESEFEEIKNYIIKKFRPITQRVIDPNSKNASETAEQFIMKLWDGRDLDYLKPITSVFRLPAESAGEIYYSWKGVTYYEFQYKRGQRPLLEFAAWLQKDAVPSHYVKADDRAEFERMSRDIAGAFARHLKNASEILKIYNDSYEDLFVRGGDPRPFIDFLKQSSTMFWDISASISAINHGVSVWQQRTKRTKENRLTADELNALLSILERVIV
jgi:hypothetical protein